MEGTDCGETTAEHEKEGKNVESRPKQHCDCLVERDLTTVPQSRHVVG